MARKIKSIFISRPDVGAAAGLSGLNAPRQPPLTSLKLHGIYHPHADRRSKSCLPRGITSCTVPLTAVQLERMRAGVFPGNAVRYPRMRFDVDIHSPCTKHRNFSQTYVCSAMQLMTPPPTRVFEITIRAVCCCRLLCHDRPNGIECMTPRVLLVRQSLFSCSACG
jgi:hypothetical protein